MEFKDKKTGEILTMDSAFEKACIGNRCTGCVLNSHVPEDYDDCFSWVRDNAENAAALMGYELVDDHFPDPTKKVEIPANSMTAMEYITHTFGRDEIICQTAEESVELAQACDDLRRVSMKLGKGVLKLRRAEHGTTPVSLTGATRAVLEECADVTVCISALEALGVFSGDELDSVVQEKLERWESRAKEYEKRVDRTENP